MERIESGFFQCSWTAKIGVVRCWQFKGAGLLLQGLACYHYPVSYKNAATMNRTAMKAMNPAKSHRAANSPVTPIAAVSSAIATNIEEMLLVSAADQTNDRQETNT